MSSHDTDRAVFADNESITTSTTTLAPGEIVIGSLVALDPQGQPLVNYPENPTGLPQQALSTSAITVQHIGRQVALLFAKGDPQRPVIMGLIHSPLHALIENYEVSLTAPITPNPVGLPHPTLDDVSIDGKHVVIDAKEQIVLKCGDASITLTKEGKIVIRGKYLLNRSSGMYRLRAGSIQVN
ncbi:MAG: hypothetical protein HY080_01610 [Gammaproteobacteria bacterium]|nr:hypothetical protein [Gammaproteobacteria bacterium]